MHNGWRKVCLGGDGDIPFILRKEIMSEKNVVSLKKFPVLPYKDLTSSLSQVELFSCSLKQAG